MNERELIADVMRSMRDAGVTYENLLYYQAHDYVRSLQVKSLLEEARRELAQDRARRSASGLAARAKISPMLDSIEALACAAVEARFDEIVVGARKQQRGDTAKRASAASKAKYERAKTAIRQDWERWQANRGDYSGKTEFARDMQQHFPCIKNHLTIVTWCREWEKGDQLAS